MKYIAKVKFKFDKTDKYSGMIKRKKGKAIHLVEAEEESEANRKIGRQYTNPFYNYTILSIKLYPEIR